MANRINYQKPPIGVQLNTNHPLGQGVVGYWLLDEMGGVDFRSFVFTFQLVPFTEDDCNLIYNIIQKFREHSYPESVSFKSVSFFISSTCDIISLKISFTNNLCLELS